MITNKHIEHAYDKHARNYEDAVMLYQLLGLNLNKYRLRAIELLQLKQNDVVIDLGCGTGLNFGPILEKIGPNGRLVGVDISSKMLMHAQERIKRSNWKNVELVHSDIDSYNFPDCVDGAISTGVLGYMDERDKVIGAVSDALVQGGRLSIVNGKRPHKCPPWLFELFVKLSSPFVIGPKYLDSRTLDLVKKYFHDVIIEEYYGGLIYICSGMVEPQ